MVPVTLVRPNTRVDAPALLADEKFARSLSARDTHLGRRRVPRRNFSSPIGLLARGGYEIEQSYQVGEGGMMFGSRRKLVVGQMVVISFYLQHSTTIVVRGVVRSVVPPSPQWPERFGVEFLTLGFQYKREIRNFVASATGMDAA